MVANDASEAVIEMGAACASGEARAIVTETVSGAGAAAEAVVMAKPEGLLVAPPPMLAPPLMLAPPPVLAPAPPAQDNAVMANAHDDTDDPPD